ncbi:arabinofuranosidase [Pseudovirgaria hyperparasitica]|uniref:Arabinofuranosidase n=1 Tax=Pseudovirgaria hyperparasitica TaxID=470096 RepID=A0A6A6WGE8_9PEZI|nr:arabinofuranosidase [Pseudovirgaria hyperparasitica]KAF2761120.1 arabinofuranosidase [Pseudovirgaria hyperparasitica]
MRLLTLLSAICLSAISLVFAANYSDPLKPDLGSDPHIVVFDGYYYLTTTTYSNVQITRATTLEGLKDGETRTVFTPDDPSRSCELWAPELHYIHGRWYLYFSAGFCTTCCDTQRPHVLIGGATPFDTYTYLSTLTSEFGIDGTVLRFPDQLYFVWSCITSDLQGLCIAELLEPGTLGETHELSLPEADWETVGFGVNEGPAAMYHKGKTFLSFSASYCGTSSYQLGVLTYVGGDPLKKASWTKTGPFLQSANGNFGPGHNGFFQSPDGTQIWNVYHATANSNGACDRSRYTMAKIVKWDRNGQPIFGSPEPLGTVMQGPSGEPT